MTDPFPITWVSRGAFVCRFAIFKPPMWIMTTDFSKLVRMLLNVRQRNPELRSNQLFDTILRG